MTQDVSPAAGPPLPAATLAPAEAGASFSAASFWSKVDRTAGPTGCWPWAAVRCAEAWRRRRPIGAQPGYATLTIGGRKVKAHQVAFHLTYGFWPSRANGLVVRHACDNPRCCNPAHLVAGTPGENSRDMAHRGRSPRGERNGQAKLTEDEVIAIRRASGQQSQEALALSFGVSRSTVGIILKGQRWKHLLEAA